MRKSNKMIKWYLIIKPKLFMSVHNFILYIVVKEIYFGQFWLLSKIVCHHRKREIVSLAKQRTFYLDVNK